MAAVDWSTLPLDLLGDIAMKLETLEDFIYFSAVCPSWKRASYLIKHQWRPIPVPRLLLSENTSNNPHCVRKIFNPSNNKSYNMNLPETFGKRCWGSDYGWLAMVDRDLNVRLFNPITKAEIRFPSAETMSVSAKSLQPNCVYFADDLFDLYGVVEGVGAIDMGVYDIKSEETRRFYKGDDIDVGAVFNPPIWFIPQL